MAQGLASQTNKPPPSAPYPLGCVLPIETCAAQTSPEIKVPLHTQEKNKPTDVTGSLLFLAVWDILSELLCYHTELLYTYRY